ncbi:MAG: hypothetical protein AB1441_07280, partial [Bacillota bacterium]
MSYRGTAVYIVPQQISLRKWFSGFGRVKIQWENSHRFFIRHPYTVDHRIEVNVFKTYLTQGALAKG